MSSIQNPNPALHSPVQGAPSTGQNNSSQSGIDPVYLAYYYLLDASNISSETANLRAKQLDQNALSQQRINNQMGSLKSFSVPSLKETHHSTDVVKWHWTWKFWKHTEGMLYTTTKVKTWTTFKNQTAVNQAQAKNQQIEADRQLMGDQLNILQQSAQIGETSVNTISNEAMQTTQEGSSLLQILQNLTFQALMTQPPQN